MYTLINVKKYSDLLASKGKIFKFYASNKVLLIISVSPCLTLPNIQEYVASCVA